MVFGYKTKVAKISCIPILGSCRESLRTFMAILNTCNIFYQIYTNGMSILYAISIVYIAGEYCCDPGFCTPTIYIYRIYNCIIRIYICTYQWETRRKNIYSYMKETKSKRRGVDIYNYNF